MILSMQWSSDIQVFRKYEYYLTRPGLETWMVTSHQNVSVYSTFSWHAALNCESQLRSNSKFISNAFLQMKHLNVPPPSSHDGLNVQGLDLPHWWLGLHMHLHNFDSFQMCDEATSVGAVKFSYHPGYS